ncbi:hypothetical protein THRCLA_20408 [Thraustotheca clavata]|uniref:Uncharacterized protein n=1 Tax=Thraustotheca clavata TaxID=74557 RepID=A0A1W0A7J9_9STRA|nr:hypothetical protein THRCLA_20408 [Thraustotheca clavata]
MVRRTCFKRYAPYSPKRPSLVEHQVYVNEHFWCPSDSILLDPVSFDDHFHKQLSLDDNQDDRNELSTPIVLLPIEI